MALERFGSIVLTRAFASDAFGRLNRGWEREVGGGLRPLLVRRFPPGTSFAALQEALQEGPKGELPSACGTGHAFGASPEAHWKLDHRASRSFLRVMEACRREDFPFGLEQALNVAWSLVHLCARFWRRGLSAGPLDAASVRLDFEGRPYLPELPWMSLLISRAEADPRLGSLAAQLPRHPRDGSLREEALRLGAFLYELFTFQALDPGTPTGPAVELAAIWSPGGPEPLPEGIRRTLHRLLGSEAPFDTLDEALAEMATLVNEATEGASTFNLAYLMHTLFRQDLAQESKELEAEREAVAALGEPALPPPALAPAPANRGRRAWVWLGAATLWVALLGAGGGLYLQDQRNAQRGLEAELARLQADFARKVQGEGDAARIAGHEAQLRKELERLAQGARDAEEHQKVQRELARLPARATSPASQALALPAPAAPTPTQVAAVAIPAPPQAAALPKEAPPNPSPAPRPEPGPAAPAPSRDRPAKLLALAAPAWPQGPRPTVRLRVFVAEDGRVLRAVSEGGSAPPPEVLQAALDAARKSRYQPSLHGGRPARDWVELQF